VHFGGSDGAGLTEAYVVNLCGNRQNEVRNRGYLDERDQYQAGRGGADDVSAPVTTAARAPAPVSLRTFTALQSLIGVSSLCRDGITHCG
jgi:hypothetical protein